MYWNSEAGAWPVNAIIMAGGKGTRLSPLTDNLHKSLIPIAGKPIIRHLIDHLAASGFREIYVSVGHLAEQVIEYLGNGSEIGVTIRYVMENTRMGSIGAITLKPDWQHEHFLVINGDIYSNFDIDNFCSQYFAKKADLAVLTTFNHVQVPYGVLEMNSQGSINRFSEKPEYRFAVNAGVYIFHQKLVELMPQGIAYEGWELIQSALNQKMQVIGLPVNDRYWVDIGSMETLRKAQEMSQIAVQLG